MKEICPNCGSENTYISEAGYNTVLVCRSCHSENHRPKTPEGMYHEVLRRLQEVDEDRRRR